MEMQNSICSFRWPRFRCDDRGLFCRVIPRWVAHALPLPALPIAFHRIVGYFHDVQAGHTFNGPVYTWLTSGDYKFEVGFLIDSLTTMMMIVDLCFADGAYLHHRLHASRKIRVTTVSSVTSRCSDFSMLMLVMSNNFMQLFFGWEAVGLVSYLLIGFWFTRPTAICQHEGLLVNRVGDFGFILGIGLVLAHFGTPGLREVFQKAPDSPTPPSTILGVRNCFVDDRKYLHLPVHRRDG